MIFLSFSCLCTCTTFLAIATWKSVSVFAANITSSRNNFKIRDVILYRSAMSCYSRLYSSQYFPIFLFLFHCPTINISITHSHFIKPFNLPYRVSDSFSLSRSLHWMDFPSFLSCIQSKPRVYKNQQLFFFLNSAKFQRPRRISDSFHRLSLDNFIFKSIILFIAYKYVLIIKYQKSIFKSRIKSYIERHF